MKTNTRRFLRDAPQYYPEHHRSDNSKTMARSVQSSRDEDQQRCARGTVGCPKQHPHTICWEPV